MLEIVFFIFGVIALGFLARHFGLLSEDAYKPINDYVYYISMPALIFIKLASVSIGQGQLPILLANFLPIAAMMLFVAFLWKTRAVDSKLAAALLLTSFFGNIVYMGFPIVEMRFGADALSQAAIISFVYNLMIFVPGMIILANIVGHGSGEFSRKKLLYNTIIISCLFGVVFSATGMVLPQILVQVLQIVGATTAPLALFSIGLFLHGKKIGGSLRPLAILCSFKLVLFPALFFGCALLLGLKGQAMQVSFLEALMPVAVTNFVIAQKFGLDEELVAESVLATTLLAIPILLSFDWLVSFLSL